MMSLISASKINISPIYVSAVNLEGTFLQSWQNKVSMQYLQSNQQ